MEPTASVAIKSLAPYRHLFPKADLSTTSLKKNATVFDTVNTVQDAVQQHAWQVEKYVNQELRGLTTYEASEKLWYFLKTHIRYQRDEDGKEQVKTPRRLISDGFGDCDDYCFFINCCMAVLKVDRVLNRITKYSGGYYQHIYPLVPIGKGNYVVVDCVVHAFNYEEPFTVKKDYEMELQVLDGIDQKSTLRGVDAQDLFDEYEMGVDGLSLKNIGQGIKNVANNVADAVKDGVQNVVQTVQTAVESPKEFVHAINILNPATALLRAGFLLSLKMNLFAVSSTLKWAYLSKDEAMARDIDPDKYDKLQQVFRKGEEIFYGAGGDKNALRDAIVNGKGNESHEVAGLGEPVEAAAIAAAASAIGALAALIGQIGGLFKKKDNPQPTPEPVVEVQQQPAQQTIIDPEYVPDLNFDTSSWTTPSSSNDGSYTPSTTSNYSSGSSSSSSSSNNSGSSPNLPAPPQGKTTTTSSATATDQGGIKSFWENNKKMIIGVGIGATVLTIGGIITYKVIQSKKKNNKGGAVNGVVKKTDKHAKRRNPTPIALM